MLFAKVRLLVTYCLTLASGRLSYCLGVFIIKVRRKVCTLKKGFAHSRKGERTVIGRCTQTQGKDAKNNKIGN